MRKPRPAYTMQQRDKEPPRHCGTVWLVGAGPGDPGLITVRGLECIRQAGVIVYDFLANPVLLEETAPNCERICAGKRRGRHTMPQKALNELLANKARAGNNVCRLKGGDPFVFGRGGEEAAFLAALGIPFEVVPGVTSAVAAPAYAGIPLTHRGIANAFHVITGHNAEEAQSPAGHNPGRFGGSLVFLMAVGQLDPLRHRLIDAGYPGHTPVAIVANGTLPTQRTILGTLRDIAQLALEAKIEPPAVVVVGDAVALSEKLAWFEKRPLFGKTLLVTSAADKAAELSAALIHLGAHVLTAPLIRIEPLSESLEMRRAARTATDFDWFVFTSSHGVEAFAQTLQIDGLDARAFGQTRIGSVGLSTSNALRKMGLTPDLIPDRHTVAGLLEAFVPHDLRGQRMLLPRSEIASPELSEGLAGQGAHVTGLTAYRTHIEQGFPPGVRETLERRRFDLAAFTSASAVQGYVSAMEDLCLPLDTVPAAAIGPVTRVALEKASIPVAITAEESTLAGLAHAIERRFAIEAGERTL